MAGNSVYSFALKIMGKMDPSFAKAMGTANKQASGLGTTFGKVAKIAAGALGAVKVGSFVKDSVSKAMEFENTMADVAKVVDGLRDSNGNLTDTYHEMSDALMNMSKKIPMTTDELGQILAAAGQAGIASGDLTRFTETAAKMGIAFDTTAEQAGTWMATWRTSLSMTQDEVETLGDQINYLGNTTSESALKLSDVVTSVGALGKTAGLGAGELAALAASMPGVSAEISATGIKNMMLAMTAGSAATKKQENALKKMGFSATDLAERMQTDAKGAIVDLLAAINRLPEAERSATLSQYFGKESVSSIAPLLSNLGYLEDQFKKVSDATAYAGSMSNEYAVRADTTANKVQLAQNQIGILQTKLGQYLLPVAGKAAEVFGGVIDKLSEMADEYGPKVVDFLSGVADKLSGIASEYGPKVIGFLKENKDMIIAVAGGVAAAVAAYKVYKGVVAAQNAVMAVYKVVTAASATGTFTLAGAVSALHLKALLIIGVIGLVVAAGILLYKNWDTIKAKAEALGAKIGEIWGRISGAVENAIAAISGKFPLLGAYLQGFWSSIQDAWANVQAIFSNIIEFISNIFSGNWRGAWDNIVAIFKNVFGLILNLAKAPLNGIVSVVTTVIEKIKSIWATVATWFNTNVITPVVRFFSPIVAVISGIFRGSWILIQAIWKAVSMWFKTNVITPVVSVFSSIVGTVGGFFSDLWGDIVGIWTAVATWFDTNVITPVVSVFSSIVEAVGGFFSGLWENVVNVWNAAGDWFSEHVAEPIKVAFQAVSDFVKGIFNGLIGFVEGMINHVIDAINGLIGGWSNIIGKAAKFIGVDWGGITEIPQVTLPRLATGGIATGPTIAEIGEGGEPEAILPLSKLAALLDGWGKKPSGGGGPAGGDGEPITFAPVFQFYGPTTREEAEEAGRVSFGEFKRLYKQMMAEERRKSFSPA